MMISMSVACIAWLVGLGAHPAQPRRFFAPAAAPLSLLATVQAISCRRCCCIGLESSPPRNGGNW